MSLTSGLIIAAVIILTVLAVIAIRLQKQVRKLDEDQKHQTEVLEAEQQKKRDSMNKSVQILAQGLSEEQLSKTEASIRISVLLEYLGVSDGVKEEYSALSQLAEATAHIPILEKWKALSKNDQTRYDLERLALEDKYGDFVVDAAKRILGKKF